MLTPPPVHRWSPSLWRRWQDLDGASGHNILDAFYAQPERFAYTFQTLSSLTRVQQACRAPPAGCVRTAAASSACLATARQLVGLGRGHLEGAR